MSSPDNTYLWHPFTQHGLGRVEEHIDRAQGAYLYRKDGRRIIDAISSWWVITHGHCHPKIYSAVQEQAQNLDQVIFAGFTHQPAKDLAASLVRLTNHHYSHVFLSDSGSTAVEVALKMAIGYWGHVGEKRTKLIALEGAYHGDTFGTMATGERGVYNQAYEPFLFDVIHAPVPLPGVEDEALSRFEAILKEHGNETAAFVFEPLVQGAGGMRIYSAQMLKSMCDMAQRYGVLLIADEVMTGFGRTGTLFACEQAGVDPDLIAISKGLTAGFLPMGATLATQRIYDAFYDEDRSKMFFHSSSFTGNPIACAAANASLQIWQDEDVLGRIGGINRSHQLAAKDFTNLPGVKNIRICGTIIALDVSRGNATGYLANIGQEFYEYALSRGLLLRALGSVIYVLPPYCVSPDDLKEIYDCITSFIRGHS